MILNEAVGIIIQARMGSTRLPAKIMMPVDGKVMLKYELDRLSSLPYPIIIATTTDQQDDAIEDFANINGYPFFRGDQNNVLSRYYYCALQFKLKTIIRITSDCPFIDSEIIQSGVEQYREMKNDRLYLSNTLDRTYPRGADFEIFSFSQLKNAYENAIDEADMEHVTPYIWKNRSGNVDIIQYKQSPDYSNFRLTLDTAEDFKLIKLLIEAHGADKLTMEEICEIMDQNPELPAINNHIEQKKT